MLYRNVLVAYIYSFRWHQFHPCFRYPSYWGYLKGGQRLKYLRVIQAWKRKPVEATTFDPVDIVQGRLVLLKRESEKYTSEYTIEKFFIFDRRGVMVYAGEGPVSWDGGGNGKK